MFKRLIKRYRIREEHDDILSKTFFYTEKYKFFYGWEPYTINHIQRFTTLQAAKKALIEGGKTAYHYL
jgi:hypothetical protein